MNIHCNQRHTVSPQARIELKEPRERSAKEPTMNQHKTTCKIRSSICLCEVPSLLLPPHQAGLIYQRAILEAPFFFSVQYFSICSIQEALHETSHSNSFSFFVTIYSKYLSPSNFSTCKNQIRLIHVFKY